MDPVPLIILAVVLLAAAVLLPFLVRLKRSARQALEAARGVEARLEAMQADRNGGGPADGRPPPEGPVRG
jgi:type II secretory pathway pseudopilin PulG